jgi:hypothetical protein
MPSTLTLFFRSIRNQHGHCIPIIATVRLYSIFQLDVFVFCPCTRTCIRYVDAVLQETMPSVITMLFRSTRKRRGNCSPIYWYGLLAPLLNCAIQLCVFFWCPGTTIPSSPRIRLCIRSFSCCCGNRSLKTWLLPLAGISSSCGGSNDA